jgi:hypothetical protein
MLEAADRFAGPGAWGLGTVDAYWRRSCNIVTIIAFWDYCLLVGVRDDVVFS